jgi:hypothetical protein
MHANANINLDDQIKRLVSFVCMKDKSIEVLELRFYYLCDLKSNENGLYIKENKLLPINEFEQIFVRLCNEGREWINISATCPFSRDIYGIEYDYSVSKGKINTSVNVSGPSTDIEGNLSRLNIEITKNGE